MGTSAGKPPFGDSVETSRPHVNSLPCLPTASYVVIYEWLAKTVLLTGLHLNRYKPVACQGLDLPHLGSGMGKERLQISS